ncbi:albumin-2-like [Trifolium pratense]|uniref:albumin-2-like n=1 Tax=Trifolium pratense TaxID=57577 RepID=UPI001E692CAC|nr:albumin-2-like [Trifolium pratense]
MTTPLVTAAFRSSQRNQCYVFNNEKYVVLDYGRGFDKKTRVIGGPIHIADGFPMFANTPFAIGIDGSYDNDGNDTFFFKGDQCAKVDFAPDTGDSRLLMGPISITSMFPDLNANTPFATGLNAAMRSNTGKIVFLFSGPQVGSFNYETRRLEQTRSISDAFPQFVGTAFEFGLDAAFNTHDRNEVYIFKGEYYAHFNLVTSEFIGFIRKIRTDWPALKRII